MTTAGDDDALTWDGDEGARPARRAASVPVDERAAALPGGVASVGRPGGPGVRPGVDGADAPAPRPGMSNALLVTLGVIGGIYLLTSIGWLLGGLRLTGVSAALVTPVGGSAPPLWGAGAVMTLVLAVAAPAAWFVAALVLTRSAPSWTRVVALVLGAVLLVPWPFIAVGAVG